MGNAINLFRPAMIGSGEGKGIPANTRTLMGGDPI